jgi:hypothetical protein
MLLSDPQSRNLEKERYAALLSTCCQNFLERMATETIEVENETDQGN